VVNRRRMTDDEGWRKVEPGSLMKKDSDVVVGKRKEGKKNRQRLPYPIVPAVYIYRGM